VVLRFAGCQFDVDRREPCRDGQVVAIEPRALADTGREQQIIKTVHGQGYVFVATVESSADTDVRDDDLRSGPVIAVLPFDCVAAEVTVAFADARLFHLERWYGSSCRIAYMFDI